MPAPHIRKENKLPAVLKKGKYKYKYVCFHFGAVFLAMPKQAGPDKTNKSAD